MLNEYDVVVVGGGPAGSMAALYAARKGVSVLLLEKDREIGYPVRCGEAISKRSLLKFFEPEKDWICTEINKFSISAPNGSEVILESSEPAFVLERKVFDYALAQKAASAGVHILTKAYVNGLAFKNDYVSGVKFVLNNEPHEVKAKIVIGADGVESRVGRWAGLKTACDYRDMESCNQYTIGNLKDIKEDICYFYFGREIAPEGYLWIFPKGNESANVGVGVSGNIGKDKSASEYLNDFVKAKYPGKPILKNVCGGVPCTVTLEKITAKGLMLAGDAARQVNPLSGGGIASGMTGGSLAGEIAADAIKNNNLDYIHCYEERWHEQAGKKHEIYNRLKKGIYKFDDDKFNKIAKSILSIPYEKRTMGKLFTTALFNQPSLLLDVAKVFIT